jgi:hypothetical protein
METLIVTIDKKKEKQIIVEQVIVTGYVKHANGRKSPFSYNKNDFEPKHLEGILNGVGRIYQ